MEAKVCYTRNGTAWSPRFLQEVDGEKCIGCGRCFKVCGRGVLMLIEKPLEGDDEYGDDMGNMIMSIKDGGNCIGCEACAKVCTRKCHTHGEG